MIGEKEYKASYTVEASLVLPIVFSTVLFLIFIGFYVHDIFIQTAVCYEIALEATYGGELTEGGQVECIRKTENVLNTYARNRIKVSVIDGKERTVSVTRSEKENKVYISGKSESKAVCENRDTPEFLRKVKRILSFVER